MNEVAFAQLEWINLHFARKGIHCAFDCVGSFWPTCTAVCVSWRERCEHAGATEVVRLRNVVDTCIEERAKNWYTWRYQLKVSTHVANDADTHGHEFALLVGCKFHILNLAAAVNGCLRVFGALFNPTNGQFVFARKRNAQQFFGVHIELRAKPTTHARRDDTNLMFGNSQR